MSIISMTIRDWLSYRVSELKINDTSCGKFNAIVIANTQIGCHVYDEYDDRLVQPGDLVFVEDWTVKIATRDDDFDTLNIITYSKNGQGLRQLIEADIIFGIGTKWI